MCPRPLALLMCVFALTVQPGCGGDKKKDAPKASIAIDESRSMEAQASAGATERYASTVRNQEPLRDASIANNAGAPEPKPEAPPPAAKVERKIKYTATISLITDDFVKADAAVLKTVDDHKGFIAFADVQSAPGSPRRAQWRIRVPVENFEAFRRAIAKLALAKLVDVERQGVNTEDVTAEFYDLEQHIKNKKAREVALREMLKKASDKLESLLLVERELEAVRDHIERSEGRLRLLANLTDLTTITITLQERARYNPDQPVATVEKPDLGARVDKTFSDSWEAFVAFWMHALLVVIAIGPWWALILPLGFLGWRTVRKAGKRTPPPVIVLEPAAPKAD